MSYFKRRWLFSSAVVLACVARSAHADVPSQRDARDVYQKPRTINCNPNTQTVSIESSYLCGGGVVVPVTLKYTRLKAGCPLEGPQQGPTLFQDCQKIVIAALAVECLAWGQSVPDEVVDDAIGFCFDAVMK